MTPLDNPVWASLCSGHEKLAIRSERAARYPEEISPLAGLAEPSREALNDLASLVAPEGFAGVLAGPTHIDEQLWQERDRIELIQMVGEALNVRSARWVSWNWPAQSGDGSRTDPDTEKKVKPSAMSSETLWT